jgi:GNAT superfamily N-acetyltransferase
MTDLDLIARALDVNEANLALGHEVFDAAGARFVRNRDVPDIRDANHVSHITAATPDEIEGLLARADAEYDGFPHRAFHADCRTPPQFEAHVQLLGYERDDALVLVLEGEVLGEPKQHEIRAVESDDDWCAFLALAHLDWAEYRRRLGHSEDATVGARMTSTRRLKQPPVQYWMAYIDGEPRGYFSSWEGTKGVGQVEDLFVQEEYRHHGLATALIYHSVAACRERGAGPVVIVADPTDTPKRMYAAMGSRPIAIKRSYRRMVEG